MNVSELLPFVPAVLFVAVAGFVAWRVSRTGSVAVPAETPLVKRPDATPAKAPADSTNLESRRAGPPGWAAVKTETVRVDVGYSTSIETSSALPGAVRITEEKVGAGRVIVDRIPVVYADQSLLKEPRQTTH